MLRNAKAFTLIELLVVVAIIGILAAIVLLTLNDVRIKAKTTRVKSSINQYRKQLEADIDILATLNYASISGAGGTDGSSPRTGAYQSLWNDIQANGGCPATATRFILGVNLYKISCLLPDGSKVFCVDSTGSVTETVGGQTASNTCP